MIDRRLGRPRSQTRVRVTGAGLAGLLASLIIAGQVAATGWHITKQMGPFTEGGDLVAVGASGLVAVWGSGGRDTECGPLLAPELWTSRSTDGGATWQPDVSLTPAGVPVHEPALGSRSSLVDLVDAEGDPLRITYRRSTDAGVTWSSPVALSTKVDDRTAPSIAHVAHQVTIAWRDPSTKRIWIRTSLDDGGTFQPPTALSASSSVPYVAIGGSTSFVVFNDTTGRLRLRRSFDGGKTWPGSTPIAYLRSDNLSDFGVAAAGSVSVITYDTPTLKVVARRSGNGGASYGPATRVGAPVPGASYQPSQFFGPRVTARPGVWTLVYTDGGQGNAFIRASTDGARTWSTPQAVPSTFGVRGYDLGGHLVMLDLYAGLDCNVRFRTWRR